MSSAALGFSSLASLFSLSRPTQRLAILKPTTFIAGLLASAGTSFNLPSLLGDIWDGLLKAVPKKKTSHMKQRSRLNAGKALKDVSGYVKCASCGNPKKQHHLCPFCTSYLYQFMPKKDETIFMHKYDLAWKNKTMPFFEDPEAVKKAEQDDLKFLYKEQRDFAKLKQLRALKNEQYREKQIAAVDENLDAWIKKQTAKMATLPSAQRIENIKEQMLVLKGVTPTGPNKAPLPASPPMPENWAAELESKLAKIRQSAGWDRTALQYELKQEEHRFFADKKRSLLGTKRLDQVILNSKSEMQESQPAQPLQSSILHSAIFGGLFSGKSEPNKSPRNPKTPGPPKPPREPLTGEALASKMRTLDRQTEKDTRAVMRRAERFAAEGKPINLEYALRIEEYRDLNRRQKFSPVYADQIKAKFDEINAIRDRVAAERNGQGSQ